MYLNETFFSIEECMDFVNENNYEIINIIPIQYELIRLNYNNYKKTECTRFELIYKK